MEMVSSTTSSINALQRPVTLPRTQRRIWASFICRFLFFRLSGLWLVFMTVLLLGEAYALHHRLTETTCTETFISSSQCFANLNSRVPASACNSTVDERVLGLALNISIASLDKSRTDILNLLDNRNSLRDHISIPQKDSLGLCMALIERTLDRLQATRSTAGRGNLELLLRMAVSDQESCIRELRNVWNSDDAYEGQKRLKSVVKQLEFPILRMVKSALALARESCWEDVYWEF